jgi:YidC/Oxa1 family membrane protein insertase
MERNHIIGIILIIAVLFVWNHFFFQPEMQEQMRKKQSQDSITLIEKPVLQDSETVSTEETKAMDSTIQTDTIVSLPETFHILENDLIQLKFSSKGGVIKEAVIKNHKKIVSGKNEPEQKEILKLLEDSKNIFEYRIHDGKKEVSTKDLLFTTREIDNRTIQFTGMLSETAKFIQT